MRTTVRAKARKLVVGSVAAAVVSLPVALVSATSAEAATTRNGCTVTPLAPDRVGTTDVIRFPVRVTCAANRIVQIRQQRFEADFPPGLVGDDFFGTRTRLRTFAVAGTVVVSSTLELPDTELGDEELYHRVRFRVATINGVSAFTNYERSVVESFSN